MSDEVQLCKDCEACSTGNSKYHQEPRCAAYTKPDWVTGIERFRLCEDVRDGPVCDKYAAIKKEEKK